MREFSAAADGDGSAGFTPGPVLHTRRDAAREALPPEVSFLAGGAVALELLHKAASLAKRQRVTAEAVLLGEGWLTQDAYYRALARHCGVRFCRDGINLIATARYPHSIHAGVAEMTPVRGARWLMAPRGADIGRLLTAVAGGLTGFEITTPAVLSEAVQLQCRRQQLSDASFGIAKADAALSAFQRGENWRPQAFAATIAGTICLCAWSSLISGIVAFVCGCVFAGAIFTRLCAFVAACTPGHDEGQVVADADLPSYTLIVPLFDEVAILQELVQALDAIDYPKAKYDVQLVVEACDLATRRAITAMNLPARYQTVVAPDGKPRTKPRALNLGLHLARGELLVVFDAEDRPEPAQLRRAAAVFAAKPWLACLQAQLAIDNVQDSWLTRMFAIEYAALFNVIDPGICQLGLPLPLGGTSNHFRTSVLRSVYGWDAWNVTEDADLGLRLARLGYEVQCLEATTLEEAPINLRAWLGQRRRWQKGWLQTIGTHLAHPLRFWRELGAFRAVLCGCALLGMALGALLGPLFAFAMWRAVRFENLLNPRDATEIAVSTLAVSLFLAGFAASVLPAWLGMQRRGLTRLLPWLALLPLYHVLSTIAAWQGLADLCRRPFYWQKTRHGVSRNRSPAVFAAAAASLHSPPAD